MTAFGKRVCRNLVAAGLAVLLTAGSALASPDQAPLPRSRPEAQPPAPPALFSKEELPAPTKTDENGSRLPKARPAGTALGSVADGESLPEAEMGRPAPATAEPAATADAAPPPPAVGASGTASAVAALEHLARTPRTRPSGTPSSVLALVAPTLSEPAPEAPMAPPVPAVPSGNDEACMARLGALGVEFARVAPIDPGGACPVAAPLKVASLGSGVAVAPEATMNCRIAEAVALWVKDVLVPKSKAHLGAIPTRIVPGSTYACRPRNNQKGAKLSEHAQANAFDVMGIVFADRPPIEIAARGTSDPEGRFQAEIRESSCAYFTTVLGPGSDASHANHLHFDMAERSRGYRLCSLGEPVIADRPAEKTKRE